MSILLKKKMRQIIKGNIYGREIISIEYINNN